MRLTKVGEVQRKAESYGGCIDSEIDQASEWVSWWFGIGKKKSKKRRTGERWSSWEIDVGICEGMMPHLVADLAGISDSIPFRIRFSHHP